MHTQPRPPLIRRVQPIHWLALDCAIAIGYVLTLSAELLREPDGRSVPLGLITIAALGLVIAIRRRQPEIALIVALGVSVAVGWPYQSLLPVWCALYVVAVRCRLWVSVTFLAATLLAPATGVPAFDRVILFGLISGLVWTIGYAVRRSLEYERELQLHRDRQAEAEREQARRGVTEERMRIARELHDVVAHSMSVITVQAGFGHLVIDEQPAQARAALSAIETTGREALTEMRQLLNVLRADGALGENSALPENSVLREAVPGGSATFTPTPSLSDLDRLITQTAKAGVHVQLEITGQPRQLPSGIELSAYRIVQEALTNVVKHAGTPVSKVTIAYCEHELAIEVTDAGKGRPVADGSGLGLIGMHERVRLYGGWLQAAPRPGHGFQVAARLPLPMAKA